MIRASIGNVVAGQAARVALAVDPLVVGEDDVRHRAVAVERGDDAGALLRVALDQHPVLVGERHVGLEDAVGEDELADVVQQRRDVDELLFLAREPGALGDRPRVARHSGGVPRGHLIAQVERAQHRAQHPDLEAGQLLAAFLQLVGALLGEQQLAEQVLEGDQDDAEEGDRRDPDDVEDEGDGDREHRAGELGGQHRGQHLQLAAEGDALHVAAVAGDHHEVDQQRELEEGEDEQVEGRVRRGQADRLHALVEGDAAEQREDRVGEQVVEQVVAFVVPAHEPADEHRGDADQRSRRTAEEDHRQDQGEEGARDLDLGFGRDRGQVAEDREGEQDGEEREVPVGLRGVPDTERDGSDQRDDHDADCETGGTLVSHGALGGGSWAWDSSRGLQGSWTEGLSLRHVITACTDRNLGNPRYWARQGPARSVAALRGVAQSAKLPASRQGQTPPTPKKAKGAPEDALQKLKRLVRTEQFPLALKDLVMKAHVPFPFDR